MKCTIDNFSGLIASELAKYNKQVTESVKEIITEEANQLVENIGNDSPKRSRKIKNRVLNRYSKNWTAKKQFENSLNISYTVYNKSDPQLTHLLENGFATRDGGRVEGQKHIEPNEEKMIESLQEKIEKAVGEI
ncbi:hypothetical protein [Sinanaerobacter chloroacetimidivorans]|uniref:HK97 gp10 family phage protein n=1 Tax=Sinanaerobacter chloroacetimidivorans TaxID=2818044 RepID=A0A8J7W285_9FIRM|nr:hypothetical protein [Sinanaerobacter chloroacetimidivorans]MBR0599046.1 hypothetical protein [Sinanaerobacter chloroacetimidivorans]